MAVYLTITWLLVSWYPHGGLHASVGMNTGSLLWVEYSFHVPLILAPLLLIWAFTGVSDEHPPRPLSPIAAHRRRGNELVDKGHGGEADRS